MPGIKYISDGPGSFHSLSQFVMSCASVLSPCPHSIDSSLFPLPCPHLKNNPHHPCWRLLLSSSCTPTCDPLTNTSFQETIEPCCFLQMTSQPIHQSYRSCSELPRTRLCCLGSLISDQVAGLSFLIVWDILVFPCSETPISTLWSCHNFSSRSISLQISYNFGVTYLRSPVPFTS